MGCFSWPPLEGGLDDREADTQVKKRDWKENWPPQLSRRHEQSPGRVLASHQSGLPIFSHEGLGHKEHQEWTSRDCRSRAKHPVVLGG